MLKRSAKRSAKKVLAKLSANRSRMTSVITAALMAVGIFLIFDLELWFSVGKIIPDGMTENEENFRWWFYGVFLSGDVFFVPLKTAIGASLVWWGIALIIVRAHKFFRRYRHPAPTKVFYILSNLSAVAQIVVAVFMVITPLLWLDVPHSRSAWFSVFALTASLLTVMVCIVWVRRLRIIDANYE